MTNHVKIRVSKADHSYLEISRNEDALTIALVKPPWADTGISRRVETVLDREALSILVAHLNQLRLELDRQPTDPPIAPKPNPE